MYVRDDVAPLGLAALGSGRHRGRGRRLDASASVVGAGRHRRHAPRAAAAGDLHRTVRGPRAGGAHRRRDRARRRARHRRRRQPPHRGARARWHAAHARSAASATSARRATSGCVDPDGVGPARARRRPVQRAVGGRGGSVRRDLRERHLEPSRRSASIRAAASRASGVGSATARSPAAHRSRSRSSTARAASATPSTASWWCRIPATSDCWCSRPTARCCARSAPAAPGPSSGTSRSASRRTSNGTLLVADTWNRRVKRLDRRYASIANWRVPDWRSEGVSDKPFVTADDDGKVYASDPTGGPGVDLRAERPTRRDAGAARAGRAASRGRWAWRSTRAAGELLVVDQSGGRVLVYALPSLRTAPGAVLSGPRAFLSDLGESRRRPAGRRGRSRHRVSPRRSRGARRSARGRELVVVRRRGGRDRVAAVVVRAWRWQLLLAPDRAHRHRAALLGDHDRLLRQRRAAAAPGRADARGRRSDAAAAASTSRPRSARSRSSACSTSPARSRWRRWWCRSRAASAAESRRGRARRRW